MIDFYAILEIDKSASQDEIKKAYRKMAMKYHPDRNQGDKKSEEKFKEVSEAYSVLSDESERDRYDRVGHDAYTRKEKPMPKWNTNHNGFNFNFGGMNSSFVDESYVNDFMNDFMKKSYYSGFGGENSYGGFRSSTKWKVDPNPTIKVRISLSDAISGGKIKISYERQIACDNCLGLGYKKEEKTCASCNGRGTITKRQAHFQFQVPCPDCGGSGKKITKCDKCRNGFNKKKSDIKITIPPGINALSKLKIEEQGNIVYANGKKFNGDLFVVVDYPNKHHGVSMDNGNIYTSIRVPIHSVMDNREISVSIFDKKEIKFNLNYENPSGHTYVIKDGGAMSGKDAFVKVFLDFPRNKISEEERNNLLKVLTDIYGMPTSKFEPDIFE